MLSKPLQQQLLGIARDSILKGFETKKSFLPKLEDYPAPLQEKRAVFVTLKIDSLLRGCIGTLEANQSLVENVAHYAYRAAFNDPRFKPLDRGEFDDIKISISILSPGEEIQFTSESDLINQLQPGTDGLIIEKDASRATFLPSVWESIANAKDFLLQLKKKANIPAYETPTSAWRYHADLIQED